MTNYCFLIKSRKAVLNGAIGSEEAKIRMIGALRLPDKMPGGGRECSSSRFGL